MKRADAAADIGKVFGHLTVLGVDEEQSQAKKVTIYRCRCDCGCEKSVLRKSLIMGKSTSCGGAVHRADKTHRKLVGQVIGPYEVLRPSASKPYFYACRCIKCGFVRDVHKSQLGDYLREGVDAQCGSCTYRPGWSRGRLTIAATHPEDGMLTCSCTCGGELFCTLEHFVKAKPKDCGQCKRAAPTRVTAEQAVLIEAYHDRIDKFMRVHRLDPSEWYDTFAFAIIRSARQYKATQEGLPFPAFLWKYGFAAAYKNELTRRNRGNSRLQDDALSLDCPTGETGQTFGGRLEDVSDMEGDCAGRMMVAQYMKLLTHMEQEVATLATNGYIYRDIGKLLGLTEAQVGRRIQTVREKLAPYVDR